MMAVFVGAAIFIGGALVIVATEIMWLRRAVLFPEETRAYTKEHGHWPFNKEPR